MNQEALDFGAMARDHALDLVEFSTEDRRQWVKDARQIAITLARFNGTVCTDDLRDRVTIPPGVDPRILGAVFRGGKDSPFVRDGWKPTTNTAYCGLEACMISPAHHPLMLPFRCAGFLFVGVGSGVSRSMDCSECGDKHVMRVAATQEARRWTRDRGCPVESSSGRHPAVRHHWLGWLLGHTDVAHKITVACTHRSGSIPGQPPYSTGRDR